MDTFSNLLTTIFGQQKYSFDNEGNESTQTIKPNIIQRIANKVSPKGRVLASTTSAPMPSVPTPPQPSPTPQPTDIEQNIRNGFARYGGGQVPQSIEPYIGQFAQAAQQYPLFQRNPYLLPSIAILETSAGQNVTRPNNLLNWGITLPENNQVFSQMNPSQVLDRAISGLGQRSPYYEPFRSSDQFDPHAFAKVYEPANPSYGANLQNQITQFQGGY